MDTKLRPIEVIILVLLVASVASLAASMALNIQTKQMLASEDTSFLMERVEALENANPPTEDIEYRLAVVESGLCKVSDIAFGILGMQPVPKERCLEVYGDLLASETP